MKNLYTQPDFELINIRLVADVLGPSTEPTEDEIPDHGGDFEEFEDMFD